MENADCSQNRQNKQTLFIINRGVFFLIPVAPDPGVERHGGEINIPYEIQQSAPPYPLDQE